MTTLGVQVLIRWVRGSSDPPAGGAAERRSPLQEGRRPKAGDDFEAAFGGSGSEDPRTQRETSTYD